MLTSNDPQDDQENIPECRPGCGNLLVCIVGKKKNFDKKDEKHKMNLRNSLINFSIEYFPCFEDGAGWGRGKSKNKIFRFPFSGSKGMMRFSR